MNIEQPAPPFGPRYAPEWPICHGMGTTEVIDWRPCEVIAEEFDEEQGVVWLDGELVA
jgi:hypothetical protein